jgi:Divergent InlB B-repeat domain
VVATPSSGYGFADWTENGGFVSASASYSFTLNSNRNLVANFYNNGGGASLATYVNAQTGSDSGTCPETAPCATLNYALSVTGAGGVITILSGDSFGPIVIDGALTIIGPPDGSGEILADPNATVGCLGALPANCGFANSGYAVQIAAGTGDNVTIANMSINAGATGSGGVLVSSGGTVILRNDEISGN